MDNVGHFLSFLPTLVGMWVESDGNSNALLDYGFSDHHPAQGLNFYRLKQSDFDGSTSYSAVRSVHFALGKAAIHAYPNPVVSHLYVNGIEAFEHAVIYNIAGQEVKRL